ncbi:MAG: hypothetical protein VR72_02545 [Clostridiaceae bacterium BRH_c20a]|nr:MAG: hypothetical protein VR72_02545 [Clostridiaceae bacterium BRH_c20a]
MGRRRINKFDIVILVFLILVMITGGKFKISFYIILSYFVLSIAYKLTKKYLFYRKLKASQIDDVDFMSGQTFEIFVLELFKKLGYKGKLTPKTADYGADIILEIDGRKIAVQTKRWNDLVSITAVQEVLGSIKYYNLDKGMVVTNNYFTENAYELAKANGIELYDRNDLIDLINKTHSQNLSRDLVKSQYQKL